MPTAKKKSSVKVTVVKKSSPARKPVAKSSTKKTVRSTSSRSGRATQTKTIHSHVVMPQETVETYTTPKTKNVSYLKNPRLWVGAAVVVVAILLYVYKGLFIAAVVNGQPISRFAVISQVEKQSGKQALGNLIVEDLVKQEAQKRHITVSQSEIDSEIKTIEGQLKGQGMTLSDALAARGLTQADLVDQITLQDLLNKMVGTSVVVSDSDVQSYIDKNQSSLPQGLSDADIRTQVKQQLEQQQLQDKTQTFVANLQKSAKINYFVSY